MIADRTSWPSSPLRIAGFYTGNFPQNGLIEPMQSIVDPKLLADACRVLASDGWLAGVPADFRAAVLSAGHLRSMPPGAMFSIAGDDASTGLGIYGVVAGQVALTSTTGGDDAPVGLLFNPGGWGGYAPLFNHRRLANSRAIVATVLLCIALTDMRRILAARPEWWEHIATLGFEAGLVYGRIATDLMLPSADRRLAAMLLHQAGCRHSGAPWPINLTQAEIGEMINLSRHPTRKLLNAFEQEGWIRQTYRCVHIILPHPMRALADTGQGR
jgi:CRP/FNR family transcriptional regulator, cyclic AMP receptor protein